MLHKSFSVLFILTAIVTVLSFTACGSKPAYSFATTKDAITACSTKLNELKGIKDADVEQVAEIINDWSVLQDSAYNKLINDTIEDRDNKLSDSYFEISDSIRDQITRITLSKPRSMKDVMYLKINTAYMRSEKQESDLYKQTKEFYDNLDKQKCYPNLKKTLENYNALLTSRKFTNEKEFQLFVAKEDLCFRSLLLYLNQVDQKELQVITARTGAFYEELTKAVARDKDNTQTERVRAYLIMRFNRRIIQNAMVCRNGVLSNTKLTPLQTNNYRWMIVQPFFSIDNISMAYLTEQQEKQLYDLAADLPDLLSTLDGASPSDITPEEKQKLQGVLVTYFINAWLKMTI